MSRLHAALFLLLAALTAAAGPSPGPAPFELQETAARAAVAAHDAAVCKAAPRSCAESRALREAYLAALDAATACDAGPCALERISKLARELAALDAREGRLPRPPGSVERPLLGLSMIATSRLTRAATALGQPFAASIYGPSERAQVDKAVEGFCLEAAGECAAMRGLVSQDGELRAGIDACAASGCPLAAVDPLLMRAGRAVSTFFPLVAPAKVETTPVFTLLFDTRNKAVSVYTTRADKAAADLRSGGDALQAQLDRAQKDPAAPLAGVEAAGGDLREKYRLAALGADRLAYTLGYGDPKNGAAARRDAVNAEAIRLSGLRARAMALRAARGLGGEKAAQGVAAGAIAGPGKAPPPAAAKPAARPTLFDARLIPSPAGAAAPAPDILPAGASWPDRIKRVLSEDSMDRADTLRRFGRTRTVGDPGRYAAVAFTQEGATSCGIVAQAQVIMAHGLTPLKEPPAVERALVAEARGMGFSSLNGGTPPEYGGSLLAERGMLTVKNRKTDPKALAAALARGNAVIASVNARPLWGLGEGPAMPHAILLSGAELSKKDGVIIGVYYNDSGVEPPSAGKFLPWDKLVLVMLDSWVEIR